MAERAAAAVAAVAVGTQLVPIVAAAIAEMVTAATYPVEIVEAAVLELVKHQQNQ